jgi:cell division protein FtsB
MRYIWLIVFNILGIYIIVSLFISKGGIIENIKKREEITSLNKQKVELQIEIEDLKERLSLLKTIENDPRQLLLHFGKIKDDSMVFKFVEKKATPVENKEADGKEILFRTYVMLFIIIGIILIGNLFILTPYLIRRSQ